MSRNWTEDFELENGQYMDGCIECKTEFIGHKRRVVCKTCANLATANATIATLTEQLAAAERNIERLRDASQSALAFMLHCDLDGLEASSEPEVKMLRKALASDDKGDNDGQS